MLFFRIRALDDEILSNFGDDFGSILLRVRILLCGFGCEFEFLLDALGFLPKCAPETVH